MTNSQADADSPAHDPLWRRRWLIFGSWPLILASLTVLGFEFSHPWSWGLLVWGVAVGVAASLAMNLVISAVLRRGAPASPAAATRLERRRVIYSGTWLMLGLLAGIVAAMFDQLWIDIAVTAYVVLIALVGFVIYRRVVRR